MRNVTFIALFLCLCGAAPSMGEPMGMDDIEYWVGSGSNRAVLVIDWNDSNAPESLAWGYRWDGSATGEDMFLAIVGQTEITGATTSTVNGSDGNLSSAVTAYVEDWGSGLFVDEIEYDNGAVYHSGINDFFGAAPKWWGYFDSVDGSTWSALLIGVSDHVLSDGDWAGWSFGQHSYWDDDEGEYVDSYVPPSSSVPAQGASPVAEPGALLVLGISAMGFIRRRRR